MEDLYVSEIFLQFMKTEKAKIYNKVLTGGIAAANCICGEDVREGSSRKRGS